MTRAVADSAELKLEDSPQHYARHLSEVNKTHEVVSTEDIYNDRGVLIARKGSRIDSGTSDKLSMHKLAKPLHSQIDIPQAMSNNAVGEEFAALFRRYPDLAAMADSSGLRGDFDMIVQGSPLPHMLLQHLTVMQLRRPEIFSKALFCTVLATLVAQRLDLHATHVRAAYYAGLFHDLGLLHVPFEVLDKRGELSASEWRAIRSHSVIGRMLVQQAGYRVPALTGLAVLEHHERCDGSGYPSGKAGNDLHVLGQIVGLTDSLQAVRVNQFGRLGLNLSNALPYLQMNETTHGYEVYAAASGLIKRSGVAPVRFNPVDTLGELVQRLLRRSRVLEKLLAPLASVYELASAVAASAKDAEPLQRVSERVLRMTRTSGLHSEELAKWLASVADHPEEALLGELGEIDLMQNELQWQLKSVLRTLTDYLEQAPDSAENKALRDAQPGLSEAMGALEGA